MSGSKSDRDSSGTPEGVSRRGFLKGAGVTVAAVGVGSPAALGQEAPAIDEVTMIGAEGARMALKLNDEVITARVQPTTTLLDLLRNDLDTTGPKRVCDRGSCGACSVMLDGKLVTSCSILAFDAAGSEVKTVEGLVADDGRLTEIQSAFVECDALQCGFCTPGMVMACSALLDKNPNPTRDDTAKAIAGNICRCGTYENIFEAVQLAASGRAKERRK